MNSSSEMVKVMSRLERMPGAMIGRVTLKKVAAGPSPRSSEASSRLRSNPSKLELSTAMEKGTAIRMWPKVTLNSERSKPSCSSTTSTEIAQIERTSCREREGKYVKTTGV